MMDSSGCHGMNFSISTPASCFYVLTIVTCLHYRGFASNLPHSVALENNFPLCNTTALSPADLSGLDVCSHAIKNGVT